MSKNVQQISKGDVERTALYLTLSKLLDAESIETVLTFFETNHILSMSDSYPISRRQIENALFQYFREGATVMMREYDTRFLELIGKRDSVA